MSFLFIPKLNVFFDLPVNRSIILSHGTVIEDSGSDAINKAKILKIKDDYQTFAKNIANRVKNGFSGAQVQDLETRPCIAVIADGATLHTHIPDAAQRELQKIDHDKAFDLGKALAEKNYRVALPGYVGLCKSVIEGVIAGGGHYVVSMAKQSVQYDEDGSPILPHSDGHGLYIVSNTLAESKSMLFTLSNHLAYLAGGVNTIDIYTDHLTLRQTSMMKYFRREEDPDQELILLNDDGVWTPFIDMLEHMIGEGFADRKKATATTKEKDDSKINVQAKSIDEVMNIIANVVPKKPAAWIPALFADVPELYIPSRAITLATNLTRSFVLKQLKPITDYAALGAELKKIKGKLKGGPIAHNALQPFVDGDTVAVYCGSRDGRNPVYLEAATAVGALLKDLGRPLVYGGSKYGLMGAVANGYINAQSDHPSHILAVTPFPFLTGTSTAENEGFHPGITATIGVPGMQERKVIMTAFSDTTIVLPGGGGTLDEKFEELELVLRNVHDKNIIVYNVNGYWDDLPALFDKAIEHGYMTRDAVKKFQMVTSIPELRGALLKGKKDRAPAFEPTFA